MSFLTFSRPLTRVLLTLAALCILSACQAQVRTLADTPQGTGGINTIAQRDKPYLILVSIDGFRWDFIDLYPTPNLDRIAQAGSRAERLVPVFPTLTFPNPSSTATGLYPAHHGLVSNDFPDPVRGKWYSLKDRDAVEDRWFYEGEPIWVSAETQGMVAASYFFVGTEAPIMGIQPSHWRSYDKDISGTDRVDQVLAWLTQPEETRPHLYTLYFEDVDSHGHWYGPDSPETIEAIRRVDGYVGRLAQGLANFPFAEQVNIIVLSDHGQATYLEDPKPFILDDYVDIGTATIAEGGSYLFMHLDVEDQDHAKEIVTQVNQNWQHGRAYTIADAPASCHLDDNPSFPDVILQPVAGYAVLSSALEETKIIIGDHGWAPEYPAMHGIFLAAGPNIKPGVKLGPVNIVDVYPFMTSILGLEGPEHIDGDKRVLAPLLQSPSD